jgi:hypothetical protein
MYVLKKSMDLNNNIQSLVLFVYAKLQAYKSVCNKNPVRFYIFLEGNSKISTYCWFRRSGRFQRILYSISVAQPTSQNICKLTATAVSTALLLILVQYPICWLMFHAQNEQLHPIKLSFNFKNVVCFKSHLII